MYRKQLRFPILFDICVYIASNAFWYASIISNEDVIYEMT